MTQKTAGNLEFTLWDVGHGLAVWIRTPSGHNHWFDLGNTPDFSPVEHARRYYGIDQIDLLGISHFDGDHLADLPRFMGTFGDPRVLLQNSSVPATEKFGSGQLDYQRACRDLDTRFNSSVDYPRSPLNPEWNGGVEYATDSLDYGPMPDGGFISGNNTSVVTMLLCEEVLIACPGDIEPLGWRTIWAKSGSLFADLISRAKVRFLVAPHHGRSSGYCSDMMDAVCPHAVLISDARGESETHPSFRTSPIGIREQDGSVKKYYTTKNRGGRIRITASSSGFGVDQYES